MYYRNEWKYMVTDAQLRLIEARIGPVLAPDTHGAAGFYSVRSLYFDDMHNSFFNENEAGVDERKKIRLRLYNGDSSHIKLEIKSKCRGMTHKTSCRVTAAECAAILNGRPPRISSDSPPPANLLSLAMGMHALAPKVIVQYERTAFVNKTGNVRITFDRNICAAHAVGSFLQPKIYPMPILPANVHVLEVKFDELLPDWVANVLELRELQKTAFSKYYLSRLALPQPLQKGVQCNEF